MNVPTPEYLKEYLKNDLMNELVKFRTELEQSDYFDDACLVDKAITRIVQLENAIRELRGLVK